MHAWDQSYSHVSSLIRKRIKITNIVYIIMLIMFLLFTCVVVIVIIRFIICIQITKP